MSDAIEAVVEDLDDRRTPPALFAEAQRRWGPFTVDAAASAENALLPRFWDRGSDGLRQCWAGERVWANVPFSDIEPWLIKAWDSAADVAVLLMPANRTDREWWAKHIEPFRDRPGSRLTTHFSDHRPKFFSPTKTSNRPSFGVVFAVWGARPVGSGA